MNILTCGLLIKTPSGYLVGHSTNNKHWDVFKGEIDVGETPFEAACRECNEEAGIDILGYPHICVNLGRHPYRKNKDLHLFLITINHDICLDTLKCTSIVTIPGKQSFPEIDAYITIQKPEFQDYLAKSMLQWLDTNMPDTTAELTESTGINI